MIKDEGRGGEEIRETTLPPHPDTFMGHHVDGRDPGDIDDWVERWHAGDSKLQLHQFLGMTWEEYGNLMLASGCLEHIVATRRMVEAGRLNFQRMAAEMTGRMN